MMNHVRGITFALALIPAVGTAQDFHAGMAAFNSGMAAFNSRDYTAAFKELLPFAEKGDTTAQFYVGQMYLNGMGVLQDYAEAVRWFRLSAVPKNCDGVRVLSCVSLFEQPESAQLSLGNMYSDGKGVPQDSISAHMWYNIAAANGLEAAASLRNKVAKTMAPADILEAQRRAQVCMASEYQDCDGHWRWWPW